MTSSPPMSLKERMARLKRNSNGHIPVHGAGGGARRKPPPQSRPPRPPPSNPPPLVPERAMLARGRGRGQRRKRQKRRNILPSDSGDAPQPPPQRQPRRPPPRHSGFSMNQSGGFLNASKKIQPTLKAWLQNHGINEQSVLISLTTEQMTISKLMKLSKRDLLKLFDRHGFPLDTQKKLAMAWKEDCLGVRGGPAKPHPAPPPKKVIDPRVPIKQKQSPQAKPPAPVNQSSSSIPPIKSEPKPVLKPESNSNESEKVDDGFVLINPSPAPENKPVEKTPIELKPEKPKPASPENESEKPLKISEKECDDCCYDDKCEETGMLSQELPDGAICCDDSVCEKPAGAIVPMKEAQKQPIQTVTLDEKGIAIICCNDSECPIEENDSKKEDKPEESPMEMAKVKTEELSSEEPIVEDDEEDAKAVELSPEKQLIEQGSTPHSPDSPEEIPVVHFPPDDTSCVDFSPQGKLAHESPCSSRSFTDEQDRLMQTLSDVATQSTIPIHREDIPSISGPVETPRDLDGKEETPRGSSPVNQRDDVVDDDDESDQSISVNEECAMIEPSPMMDPVAMAIPDEKMENIDIPVTHSEPIPMEPVSNPILIAEEQDEKEIVENAPSSPQPYPVRVAIQKGDQRVSGIVSIPNLKSKLSQSIMTKFKAEIEDVINEEAQIVPAIWPGIVAGLVNADEIEYPRVNIYTQTHKQFHDKSNPISNEKWFKNEIDGDTDLEDALEEAYSDNEFPGDESEDNLHFLIHLSDPIPPISDPIPEKKIEVAESDKEEEIPVMQEEEGPEEMPVLKNAQSSDMDLESDDDPISVSPSVSENEMEFPESKLDVSSHETPAPPQSSLVVYPDLSGMSSSNIMEPQPKPVMPIESAFNHGFESEDIAPPQAYANASHVTVTDSEDDVDESEDGPLPMEMPEDPIPIEVNDKTDDEDDDSDHSLDDKPMYPDLSQSLLGGVPVSLVDDEFTGSLPAEVLSAASSIPQLKDPVPAQMSNDREDEYERDQIDAFSRLIDAEPSENDDEEKEMPRPHVPHPAVPMEPAPVMPEEPEPVIIQDDTPPPCDDHVHRQEWSWTPEYLTMIPLRRLKEKNKVDYRDKWGQFRLSIVQEKKRDILTIRYWEQKQWVQLSVKMTVNRFAPRGSVSKRPASRFTDLKKGDMLDVYPPQLDERDQSPRLWISGTITKLDENSGQVQVEYKKGQKNWRHWFHLDDSSEVALAFSQSTNQCEISKQKAAVELDQLEHKRFEQRQQKSQHKRGKDSVYLSDNAMLNAMEDEESPARSSSRERFSVTHANNHSGKKARRDEWKWDRQAEWHIRSERSPSPKWTKLNELACNHLDSCQLDGAVTLTFQGKMGKIKFKRINAKRFIQISGDTRKRLAIEIDPVMGDDDPHRPRGNTNAFVWQQDRTGKEKWTAMPTDLAIKLERLDVHGSVKVDENRADSERYLFKTSHTTAICQDLKKGLEFKIRRIVPASAPPMPVNISDDDNEDRHRHGRYSRDDAVDIHSDDERGGSYRSAAAGRSKDAHECDGKQLHFRRIRGANSVKMNEKHINDWFYSSMPTKKFQISKVEDISEKVGDLSKQMYTVLSSSHANPNETYLWYACKQSDVAKIIENGFDHKVFQRYRKGVPARYGKGIYFSSSAELFWASGGSTKVIIDDKNVMTTVDERIMLVCRVMMGHVCEWNHKDGHECDSVVDSMEHPSLVVVCNEYGAIPVFLVKFHCVDSVKVSAVGGLRGHAARLGRTAVKKWAGQDNYQV